MTRNEIEETYKLAKTNKTIQNVNITLLIAYYEGVIDYHLKEGWELEDAVTMTIARALF